MTQNNDLKHLCAGKTFLSEVTKGVNRVAQVYITSQLYLGKIYSDFCHCIGIEWAYVTYGNNNKHFHIALRQNDGLGGEMNPNICLLVAYRADAPMIPSPSLTVPLKCNFQCCFLKCIRYWNRYSLKSNMLLSSSSAHLNLIGKAIPLLY